VTALQPRVTATIPLTVTLLSPLHHGAGNSGNTQLLRTAEIVLPDGSMAVVPWVSGSSLRHAIRHACAELTLTAVAATPRTLTKPVVDLLYSGGALTSSPTAQVDLATHRRLDELWAPAGLLGYAGRGQIWAGSLYVDHLNLVCEENAWRLPQHLAAHPHRSLPAAALRDEDFGTRHDTAGGDGSRWLDVDLWAAVPAEYRTNQMIFDWQVIRAGAVLYGTLRLAAATVAHVQALHVAWQWLTAAGTMNLGAKRAQGYGLCRVDADWSAIPPAAADMVTALQQHPAEVLASLTEAAGK
jgi:hypothetical protein